MKRYSLQKLFQQTFEDHEGRPGKVGGSLPRSGGSGGARSSAAEEVARRRREHARSSAPQETPKKLSNTLGKSIGEKFSSSSGQTGVLKAYARLNKMETIKTDLWAKGFETYADDLKDNSVTSFKKGSLRVHVTPVETMEGDRLMITITQVSDRLPHVPYD